MYSVSNIFFKKNKIQATEAITKDIGFIFYPRVYHIRLPLQFADFIL
jgi:hypothetical protein